MKLFITVFFALLFWSQTVQDYYFYQNAFKEIIASSDAFRESDCYCEGDFVIMEEIVPFDKMSFMFTDKLSDYLGRSVQRERPLSYSDLDIGKKKSKLKIFFSEQKDGVFFAELFCDAKKKLTSFDMISSFGVSYVYMFKINSEGNIELVDQKEISSN